MTKRACGGLTTDELYRLDHACALICDAFDHEPPYLVGSAQEGDGAYRDVDVRLILEDGTFDVLFDGNRARWELLCLAIGDYLRKATGLPIDFQIQRMTEANEKHPGKQRNPLGLNGRVLAAGGDATPEWPTEQGRRRRR